MFEEFSFGILSINPVYVMIGLSLLIAYLFIWKSEDKRALFGVWLTSLLIVLVTYKLSFLIFGDAHISNIIYSNGGSEGLLLGLIFGFIFLMYKTDRLFFIESYIFWILPFLMLYGYLEVRAITQWPYVVLIVITLAALIVSYFMWTRFRALFILFVTVIVTQLIGRIFIYNGTIVFGLSLIEWLLVFSLVYVVMMTFRGVRNEAGVAVTGEEQRNDRIS